MRNPVRLAPEKDSLNGNPTLACPICGDEFTHLRTVKPFDTDGDIDRLSVVLRFYCERANHDFFFTFKQYAGQTEIIGVSQ